MKRCEEMKHITVLLDEAIKQLNIKPNGIYVDGTLGGAGHSKKILEQLKTGYLYAFDQDEIAIDYANGILKDFNNFKIIKSNFRHLKKKLNEEGITHIDGLLLDLGMSSFQIDDDTRGFTYLKDAKLDMRMDQSQSLTAEEIVNTYSKDELAKLFFIYGEEKNGFKIAQKIINQRPLYTTMELVKITDQVNYKDKGHSAKRVFQALRIAVNHELGVLEEVLEQALDMLNPKGRIVVITFHSLEDRIVKHYFKEKSTSQLPKNLPVMIDENIKLKVLTKKPIYPTDEEINKNSRARSAKMRVAERI
jgi:16S rRNA (cytosine1402-N4)-methyltransferase